MADEGRSYAGVVFHSPRWSWRIARFLPCRSPSPDRYAKTSSRKSSRAATPGARQRLARPAMASSVEITYLSPGQRPRPDRSRQDQRRPGPIIHVASPPPDITFFLENSHRVPRRTRAAGQPKRQADDHEFELAFLLASP